MNKFLSITILCLCFSQIFGQNKTNELSLSFGPSFPLGDYSNTSLNNKFSGFAKTGQAISINYSRRLKNNLGLEAMLYGQRNPINTSAFANELSKSGGFTNWTVNEKSWYATSLLLGISKELAISSGKNKISIKPNVLAGVAYAQSPSIKAESKMNDMYAKFTQSKSNGFGASILVGTLVSYQLSPVIGLSFHLEYLTTSKITFDNITSEFAATNGGLVIPGLYEISNSRNPPIYSQSNFSQKNSINALNTKLGINFYF